ncbi:MAG: hypothetical protein KKD56_00255 [Acidobacteria bacterium]|nr:hypothetical protein [Acidobacteriota bacterium]MBU4203411.1 hypothetical protein [Acidobacteriota bacterium]
MKKTVTILLFLLINSLVFSQSLVDLSKREKERRARLKGKTIIIQKGGDPARKGATLKTDPSGLAEETEGLDDLTSLDRESPPQKRMIPKTENPPEETGADQKDATDLQKLEEQLRKAKEYVELLTLKMNALWQEFYSMDDMKSRDEIQRQISETYLNLQKAQANEQKLQKDVEARKK